MRGEVNVRVSKSGSNDLYIFDNPVGEGLYVNSGFYMSFCESIVLLLGNN